jgi:hypothetical protein
VVANNAGGHYWYYRRENDSRQENDSWIKLNDSSVTAPARDTVQQEHNNHAYVLFYSKV